MTKVKLPTPNVPSSLAVDDGPVSPRGAHADAANG